MGVFVSAVLLGVNLGRIGHEAAGMQGMRLGEQRVVGRLGVIAELVPLDRKFVKISGGPVMLGGEQVGLDGGVSGHETSIRRPERGRLVENTQPRATRIKRRMP